MTKIQIIKSLNKKKRDDKRHTHWRCRIRKGPGNFPEPFLIGGCDRDRTCDPYDVNVVLIPLSYTPV